MEPTKPAGKSHRRAWRFTCFLGAPAGGRGQPRLQAPRAEGAVRTHDSSCAASGRRDVEGGGGEGVRTRPPGRGPGWDFQLVAPPPRPSMSSTFNRRGWPGPQALPWADCRDSGPPCLPGANSARLAGTPGNKATGPGTQPRRLPGPSTATEAFVSTGLRSAAGDTVTTWPKAPPTTGRAS